MRNPSVNLVSYRRSRPLSRSISWRRMRAVLDDNVCIFRCLRPAGKVSRKASLRNASHVGESWYLPGIASDSELTQLRTYVRDLRATSQPKLRWLISAVERVPPHESCDSATVFRRLKGTIPWVQLLTCKRAAGVEKGYLSPVTAPG